MDELAPLPVALPLIMAAVLVVLEKVPGKRRLLDLLSMMTAVAVLLLDLLLLEGSFRNSVVYWFGGWTLLRGFAVGIAFVIDPAGAALAAVAAMLTAMGFIFSWHYFKAIGTFYHTLMLLFLASMQGFSLTGDLFNMFVFFELMGVAAYALTGYNIEDTGPLEGALNFAVMNSIGGFLVLFGIGIVYAKTGALNMAMAGAQIRHGGGAALTAAFILLSIGFLVKGAIIPFHFWLPDAHAVAPTPASVLFSGIMVELGLYAVARIYWTVFYGSIPEWVLHDLLFGLGCATAVTGACMAFIQRHLKRLLAFSTVSHSGLMLAGLAMLDPRATGGTLLYIASHGFVKGGLFICTGIILNRSNSVDEEFLRGELRHMKVVGPLFCLSGLALAGLPPFGTFAGKALIEKSAESLNLWWATPVFLFCSAVTGGAVLRAGASLFFGLGGPNFLSASAPSTGEREHPEAGHQKHHTPLMMWLPLVMLLSAALAAGVFPQVAERACLAGERFSDTEAYRSAVLHAGLPVRHSFAAEEGAMDTASGVAGALVAVLIAAAALYYSRLPEWLVSLLKAAASPFLHFFRRIHSGYIGDYVTWFTIGAALLMLAAFT